MVTAQVLRNTRAHFLSNGVGGQLGEPEKRKGEGERE